MARIYQSAPGSSFFFSPALSLGRRGGSGSFEESGVEGQMLNTGRCVSGLREDE